MTCFRQCLGGSSATCVLASAGHVWLKSSAAALPRRISQKCSVVRQISLKFYHIGGFRKLPRLQLRDAVLSRIPAPRLLKQEQLQLAGASFREKGSKGFWLPILFGPLRATLAVSEIKAHT